MKSLEETLTRVTQPLGAQGAGENFLRLDDFVVVALLIIIAVFLALYISELKTKEFSTPSRSN
ncbi:MAG: hypothetical protein QXF92_03445 [Thermosphaera sp.]